MKSITLGKFPLPPSSNNQYASLIMKGRVIHVPTVKLKAFKVAMSNWHLSRDRLAQQARMFCLEIFSRKNFVRFDSYLCVPKVDIFYKNGNLKRDDIFNRLKALHDEFSKMAGFDDSRIKAGWTEQLGIEGDSAFSFIVLSEHRFRMISEYQFGELPK